MTTNLRLNRGKASTRTTTECAQDETLVDGTSLGIPVMGIHMHDVGFSLENCGVQPDMQVAMAPHDFATSRDPQLDAAIEEATKLLAAHQPQPPPCTPRLRRAAAVEAAVAVAASAADDGDDWPFATWQAVRCAHDPHSPTRWLGRSAPCGVGTPGRPRVLETPRHGQGWGNARPLHRRQLRAP